MDRIRFLSVGAAHWDVIARAETRMAIGDDVPGAVIRRAGGVALNIAIGLARRGCAVGLCAAIGRDVAGEALLRLAEAEGVDCASVAVIDGATTDAYVAIEDGAGELFGAVAACGTLEAQAGEIVRRACAALSSGQPGTLVLEANLPEAAIGELADRAREAGWRLVVNPVSSAKAARLSPALDRRNEAIIIANRAEAVALTGGDHDTAAHAAAALLNRGAAVALVTDGPHGAALATEASVFERAPKGAGRVSVTGAGDALLAGYLACAERDADPEAALRAALEAAEQHMTRSR